MTHQPIAVPSALETMRDEIAQKICCPHGCIASNTDDHHCTSYQLGVIADEVIALVRRAPAAPEPDVREKAERDWLAFLLWQADEAGDLDAEEWDKHSPDNQRYYDMADALQSERDAAKAAEARIRRTAFADAIDKISHLRVSTGTIEQRCHNGGVVACEKAISASFGHCRNRHFLPVNDPRYVDPMRREPIPTSAPSGREE